MKKTEIDPGPSMKPLCRAKPILYQVLGPSWEDCLDGIFSYFQACTKLAI